MDNRPIGMGDNSLFFPLGKEEERALPCSRLVIDVSVMRYKRYMRYGKYGGVGRGLSLPDPPVLL